MFCATCSCCASGGLGGTPVLVGGVVFCATCSCCASCPSPCLRRPPKVNAFVALCPNASAEPDAAPLTPDTASSAALNPTLKEAVGGGNLKLGFKEARTVIRDLPVQSVLTFAVTPPDTPMPKRLVRPRAILPTTLSPVRSIAMTF